MKKQFLFLFVAIMMVMNAQASPVVGQIDQPTASVASVQMSDQGLSDMPAIAMKKATDPVVTDPVPIAISSVTISATTGLNEKAKNDDPVPIAIMANANDQRLNVNTDNENSLAITKKEHRLGMHDQSQPEMTSMADGEGTTKEEQATTTQQKK